MQAQKVFLNNKYNMKNKNLPPKLEFGAWCQKYFEKDQDHNYWTSNYEKVVIGFAPGDLSRWKESDLKEEYEAYLQDKNEFNEYEESTNEMVDHEF